MKSSTPEIIDSFFSSYNLRQYKKGQVLLLDGEGPERMFYITSGRVKVYDISYRGDEIILGVFGPGTFFPVALVVNKTSSRYIYEAETDIEVRQTPADDAVQFLKDNPEVVFFTLGQVYARMDDVLGRMSHLMASSAKRRLIYELLLECRHFGQSEKGGVHTLTVSEKDIGCRAGLSRETVSREINKLKREKLVDVRQGTIVILNIADLEWRHNHIA